MKKRLDRPSFDTFGDDNSITDREESQVSLACAPPASNIPVPLFCQPISTPLGCAYRTLALPAPTGAAGAAATPLVYSEIDATIPRFSVMTTLFVVTM
jgi:hypothetical protein